MSLVTLGKSCIHMQDIYILRKMSKIMSIVTNHKNLKQLKLSQSS